MTDRCGHTECHEMERLGVGCTYGGCKYHRDDVGRGNGLCLFIAMLMLAAIILTSVKA